MKTLNIVPFVEGNLLLFKANKLYTKKGETRNFKWLLDRALIKFSGTNHFMIFVLIFLEALSMFPGGYAEIYNVAFVNFKLGCLPGSVLEKINYLSKS